MQPMSREKAIVLLVSLIVSVVLGITPRNSAGLETPEIAINFCTIRYVQGGELVIIVHADIIARSHVSMTSDEAILNDPITSAPYPSRKRAHLPPLIIERSGNFTLEYVWSLRITDQELLMKYLTTKPLKSSVRIEIDTKEHGLVVSSTEIDLSRYSLWEEGYPEYNRREMHVIWRRKGHEISYSILLALRFFNPYLNITLTIRIPRNTLDLNLTEARGVRYGYIDWGSTGPREKLDGLLFIRNEERRLILAPNSESTIFLYIEPNRCFDFDNTEGTISLTLGPGTVSLKEPYLFGITYPITMNVVVSKLPKDVFLLRELDSISTREIIWQLDQIPFFPEIRLGELVGFSQSVVFDELMPPGIGMIRVSREDMFVFPRVSEEFVPIVSYSFPTPKGVIVQKENSVFDGNGTVRYSSVATKDPGTYYRDRNERIVINVRPHNIGRDYIEYSVRVNFLISSKEEYHPRSFWDQICLLLNGSSEHFDMGVNYPMEFSVSLTNVSYYHVEFLFPEYVRIVKDKWIPAHGQYSADRNRVIWNSVDATKSKFNYTIWLHFKVLSEAVAIGRITLSVSSLILVVLAVWLVFTWRVRRGRLRIHWPLDLFDAIKMVVGEVVWGPFFMFLNYVFSSREADMLLNSIPVKTVISLHWMLVALSNVIIFSPTIYNCLKQQKIVASLQRYIG